MPKILWLVHYNMVSWFRNREVKILRPRVVLYFVTIVYQCLRNWTLNTAHWWLSCMDEYLSSEVLIYAHKWNFFFSTSSVFVLIYTWSCLRLHFHFLSTGGSNTSNLWTAALQIFTLYSFPSIVFHFLWTWKCLNMNTLLSKLSSFFYVLFPQPWSQINTRVNRNDTIYCDILRCYWYVDILSLFLTI